MAALLCALPLAGCGGGGAEANGAQGLLPQLSDLPTGSSLNLAESFPVSLDSVLAEPWSAGVRDVIERERLSGYQVAFTNDRGRQIQCNAAVYRSSGAAAHVFATRAEHFSDFAVASGGGVLAGNSLGDETRRFRYQLGNQPAVTIAWRSENVLSSCTTVGRAPDVAELLVVARAQQLRIARNHDAAGRSGRL